MFALAIRAAKEVGAIFTPVDGFLVITTFAAPVRFAGHCQYSVPINTIKRFLSTARTFRAQKDRTRGLYDKSGVEKFR